MYSNAQMPRPSNVYWRAEVNVCSAVSYFSTLLGSIIGAGRLSFRVRDGTGRFPAAMAAVTLFTLFWASHCVLWEIFVFWWWGVDSIAGFYVSDVDVCGCGRHV